MVFYFLAKYRAEKPVCEPSPLLFNVIEVTESPMKTCHEIHKSKFKINTHVSRVAKKTPSGFPFRTTQISLINKEIPKYRSRTGSLISLFYLFIFYSITCKKLTPLCPQLVIMRILFLNKHPGSTFIPSLGSKKKKKKK